MSGVLEVIIPHMLLVGNLPNFFFVVQLSYMTMMPRGWTIVQGGLRVVHDGVMVIWQIYTLIL